MRATMITVASHKGGVAKTTTATTAAHALALTDATALVIDTDPQGSCALALGMDPEPGLFDLFADHTHPANLIRHTGRPNLWLLPGNTRTRALIRTLDAGLEHGTLDEHCVCRE